MSCDYLKVVIGEDSKIDKDIIYGFQKVSEIASPFGIPVEDALDIDRLGDRLCLGSHKPSRS